MMYVSRVFAIFMMLATASMGHAVYHENYFQGVNYLQTVEVSLNSFTSMQSLRRIKANGADTVALIGFMHQDAADSIEMKHSTAVTDKQLIQAIADAHDIGLRVILKPQVLVNNSWAGEIKPSSQTAWQQWFESYQSLLQHYAQIAQQHEVAMLVIGTELRHAAIQPQFRQLIIAVRKIYMGELSYAAHGTAGLKNFPHWDLLDSVSLTLYPSLGNEWDIENIKLLMAKKMIELRSISSTIDKPLWIAEIGISSAQDSFREPWLVKERQQSTPDTERQAKVLELWLQSLRQPWIQGVLIWSWSSNAEQDGMNNTGFDIQNKPAEKLVSCYWKKEC